MDELVRETPSGERLPPPIDIIGAFTMKDPFGREGICVTVVSLGDDMSTSTTKWIPLPLPTRQEWELGINPPEVELIPELEEEIKRINTLSYFRATGRDSEGNEGA